MFSIYLDVSLRSTSNPCNRNRISAYFSIRSIGVIFVGARFIAPLVMGTLLTWDGGAINRAPTTLFTLKDTGGELQN